MAQRVPEVPPYPTPVTTPTPQPYQPTNEPGARSSSRGTNAGVGKERDDEAGSRNEGTSPVTQPGVDMSEIYEPFQP